MMNQYAEAVVLGAVQGLTEFLPISSSGHLLVIPKIFGWNYFGKSFDVALHMGTFGALFIYFWKDLWKIVTGSNNNIGNSAENKLCSKEKAKRFLLRLLIISTIPGVLAGLFFNDFIEERLNSIHLVLEMMAAFAVLLWVSDLIGKSVKKINSLTFMEAVLLGIAQAIALIPGVSRSGVTITTGRFLGLSREEAAKYSFLMAIPITGGAGFYKGLKLLKHGFGEIEPLTFLIGMVTSLIVGYICIAFFLRYLQKHGMFLFVIYRLLLATVILLLV